MDVRSLLQLRKVGVNIRLSAAQLYPLSVSRMRCASAHVAAIARFSSRKLCREVQGNATSGGAIISHYVNLFNWPVALGHKIGRIVPAVIARGGIVWAWRPVPNFRTRRYVLEIAGMSAFMLWASERTWAPHYVTLIFSLFAVGMLAADAAATSRSRQLAWASLGLTALLMPWASELAKVFGPNGRHYVDCAEVVLWSSLALVGAIICSRYKSGTDFQPAESCPPP